jgi:hypothetical protein
MNDDVPRPPGHWLSVGWRRCEAAARRLWTIYDQRSPSRAAIEGIAAYVLGATLATTIVPDWMGAPSRNWLFITPGWAILILTVAVGAWALFWFFFRVFGRTTAADAARKAALLCWLLGVVNAAAGITWPVFSRVL